MSSRRSVRLSALLGLLVMSFIGFRSAAAESSPGRQTSRLLLDEAGEGACETCSAEKNWIRVAPPDRWKDIGNSTGAGPSGSTPSPFPSALSIPLSIGAPPATGASSASPVPIEQLAPFLTSRSVRELLLLLDSPAAVEANLYAIKRLSSVARGIDPDIRVDLVLLAGSSAATLAALARGGATPYVDSLSPPADTSFTSTEETDLLAEGWPTARLLRRSSRVEPVEAFLNAVSDGASAVYLTCAESTEGGATDSCRDWWNDSARIASYRSFLQARGLEPASGGEPIRFQGRENSGAPDAANRVWRDSRAPAFLDPKTLSTWIVLPGSAATVSLPNRPERLAHVVDPIDGKELAVRRNSRGEFVIVTKGHPLFVRLDRGDGETPDLSTEITTTAAAPGLTAGEIIARHRVRRSRIDQSRKSFIAENRTALKFRIGGLSESLELEIRGPYFWNGDQDVEWVWREFWFNGVKWRGEKVPELPLMQPEKVAAPPLAIAFTEDYAYERLDDTFTAGRKSYVLAFSPRAAAAHKSLFRGRAWIDQETFDLLRTEAIQSNPGGEILSNEEIAEFTPAADGFPLATTISGQTTMSTAGSVTVVEKTTRLIGVRFNPAGFEDDRQAVRASAMVMVKETDRGIRYFEPVKGEPAGTRRIREGLEPGRLFGLAGVFADDSLAFPLLGINYLNFNLGGKGAQTNVFFGGALISANLTEPHLFGTKFDLGADLFAIAIKSNEDVFRGGKSDKSQRVRTRPASFQLNLGHPLGDFFKASFRYRYLYNSYENASETAPDFRIPSSGATHGMIAELRYDRLGYGLSAEYGIYRRSRWEFWGKSDGSDYDPDSKRFAAWKLSAVKEWSLPDFQKFRLEASYLDGQNLDRFSKYSFGFFGSTRVSGFKSGAVRIDKAVIASGTYGLSIASVFRLDLTVDHAWATDRASGYHGTGFTGASLGGNTNGPWQTIVQYSVGVPLQGPEKNGFVLYLVLLKLF